MAHFCCLRRERNLHFLQRKFNSIHSLQHINVVKAEKEMNANAINDSIVNNTKADNRQRRGKYREHTEHKITVVPTNTQCEHMAR